MTGQPRCDGAFATAVVLTKREVFDALEACAGAERALLRSGKAAEAAAVAALFELLEDRVVLDPSGPATTRSQVPPEALKDRTPATRSSRSTEAPSDLDRRERRGRDGRRNGRR